MLSRISKIVDGTVSVVASEVGIVVRMRHLTK